ncbi:MAG: XkdX family protein [Selenomonadaceae bacterium]|nr:XkdX family protein [Selenomonadaceae bacterium]
MFERLKRLYDNGQISKDAILAAVSKGWITKEQAEEIINLKNDQNEGDV